MTRTKNVDWAQVAATGVLAPSVLNTQPWTFHAYGGTVDVVTDPSRAAVHLDPQGRELLMSCGAALFNLQLAVAAQSREPVVTILPDAARPEIVGRVVAGDDYVPTATDLRLHAAIPHRRTSREPFEDRVVPEPVIAALVEAAEAEGARLDQPPPWHLASITGLVHDADRAQRDRPEVVEDVLDWTGGRSRPGSGIPDSRLGPRPADPSALVRDFSMRQYVPDRPVADFGEAGVLMVLLTPLDTPSDRIKAGIALEHVLLEAASHGVSATLLTQPVEVPELRQWLRDPGTAFAYPQALMTFGYGPVPPPTPRRPVSDVLVLDP